MLDLQRLRYFVAVAELENVGRAARLLHLTQSPLSRQIQCLEADLGIMLFQRSKKRLKLTAAGRDFLVEAKALLSHGARVEGRARAIATGSAGSLVIGYVAGALHAGVLARWLRAHAQRVPDVEIELKNVRSHDQHRQLVAREIDIGFAHARPGQDEPVRSKLIYQEAFKLAVPRASKYGAAPSARELSKAKFIAWPGSGAAGGRSELVEACRAAGFEPDIRYEAADPLAVLEMVGAGLGLAVVQASLARIKPRTVSFADLPRGFDMTMSIHLTCADACAPAAETFFDLSVAPAGSAP
ncbi:LysR family transcriptional regulator [Bradyrhizobium sp. SK17]|uniref:LysR substrate-binding domain-containing protein n=1 Tax=Bradyrhizobium sp. SK17 TaxID=2057741 RepID=UPI000C30D41E|nr:LysR substrate-binding domain-containing protein [Bradyrhizobium sp. SK17]AUC98891.1 LysR family transcriptional regulator [Bradyrhizobium sp. SK17]